MSLANAEVYVRKADGSTTGPYTGTLSAKNFIIMNGNFDGEEGEHLTRALPSGREESYLIRNAQFYDGMVGIPANWQLDIEKTTAIQAASSQKSTTINIHSSTGIQVGDNNMMNFEVAVNEMIKKIDASDAPDEKKTEAKSLLQAFLTHPLTISIAGGITGAIMR